MRDLPETVTVQLAIPVFDGDQPATENQMWGLERWGIP